MNWKCPQCGESNPDSTKLCGLCGEMRPAVKAEPVVVRAMAPPQPAPAAPLPQVLPNAARWDQLDPAHSSDVEKKRLAEEAAGRILGKPTDGTRAKAGCGTVAIFIMFLPWSLVVLPMPGGLRNKRAGQVLLVIAVVLLIATIISLALAAPHIMKLVKQISSGYNVDPGD